MAEAGGRSPGGVLALAWLAAFSLRTGFIGLGPLLPLLVADLRLSATAASLLVAIPTVMMGLVSAPGGQFADRRGAPLAIALGLAAVTVGGAARALSGSWAALLAATILFGAGIGLAQPALPRLTRSLFPGRLGLATGVYASGLIAGSITAASLTLPVEERFFPDAGWRGPLLFWGALSAATLLVWLVALRPWRSAGTGEPAPRPRPEPSVEGSGRAAAVAPGWSPWRDRRVWIVALLFAAQGIGYYLLVAWLPAVYADLGVDAGRAGAFFGVFNAATLPAILGFPILSDRMGSRRWPSGLASAAFVVGAAGLVTAPTAGVLAWLWPALAGCGVAGLFAMALLLPADVAPGGRVGAAAGMVLAVGYAGSALGPVMAGMVRDLTGSFSAALLTLPLIGLACVALSVMLPPPGGERG